MHWKQQERTRRRLRKAKNRAEHRERTWEDLVAAGREKWSKKADQIIWAHSMYKRLRGRSSPPANPLEAALTAGAKKASPELLNWAVRVSGKRYIAIRRGAKAMAKFIEEGMRSPGFARRVFAPNRAS